MRHIDIAAEQLIHDVQAETRKINKDIKTTEINEIAQEIIAMGCIKKYTFTERQLCIELFKLNISDYTAVLSTLKAILSDKEYEKYFKYLQKIRTSLKFTDTESQYFKTKFEIELDLKNAKIIHSIPTKNTVTSYIGENAIHTQSLAYDFVIWDLTFQQSHNRYPTKNEMSDESHRLLKLQKAHEQKIQDDTVKIFAGIFFVFILFCVLVSSILN